MNDSTARFLSILLDRVDDFVSEFRTRMVATQLIRSVAATAAKYRAVRSTRRRFPVTPKMCLVLEEADPSTIWLERIAHHRLLRRLELVRQTLFVADEIIEKTFPQPEPSGVRRPVVSVSCQLSGGMGSWSVPVASCQFVSRKCKFIHVLPSSVASVRCFFPPPHAEHPNAFTRLFSSRWQSR
jgi:hypothetical protein